MLRHSQVVGPITQESAYIVALVSQHITTDSNKILKTVGILENNKQVKTARSIATYRFNLGLSHTNTHIHEMLHKCIVSAYSSSVAASNTPLVILYNSLTLRR